MQLNPRPIAVQGLNGSSSRQLSPGIYEQNVEICEDGKGSVLQFELSDGKSPPRGLSSLGPEQNSGRAAIPAENIR